jgi:hypothetical protein
MIESLLLWEEEYDAITKAEEKEGDTKEIARRLLIWTEGFVMKVSSMSIFELNDEKNRTILQRIFAKNKTIMERLGEMK